MIKLFVSDIDGCLAEPFQPYDRDRFAELAAYVEEEVAGGGAGPLPAFSLCSGRSGPYVEAMTQALGLRCPVLFECGGGLYDPATAGIIWHPSFTEEVDGQLEEVRQWMRREATAGTSVMYDYGKRTMAGLIGADREAIASLVPVVEAFIEGRFPDLCVFHTAISIDVVAATITKKQGLLWLAERLGCPVDRMAYIGDANGDVEALEVVGFSFAPSNATEAAKRAARICTEHAVVEGVLEAYHWCVAHNRQALKKAS